MKSVWDAQVRTLEEDELSEECVCEPPQVCLCCHRPPETVERDLLYAYQGLKDTTKDAEPFGDHLFTRVFPCTKHITGEATIKLLLEEWFCVYGAAKEIDSDEDVRVRSDTGWYKRVLRSFNVQVSTGIPYTHTNNPLCERQIPVIKGKVSIW